MTIRKREWTIRIIIHHEAGVDRRFADRDSWWLGEALRYAGISRRLATFENPAREVFEIRRAGEPGTETWAHMNAERLRSFGMDAAAAPAWGNMTYEEQTRAKEEAELSRPPY